MLYLAIPPVGSDGRPLLLCGPADTRKFIEEHLSPGTEILEIGLASPSVPHGTVAILEGVMETALLNIRMGAGG